jgi:mannose-1-phosphate guanylyltransferase
MANNYKIITVLLAGGEGKRLNPFTSALNPKQFIKFHWMKKSFFQLALELANLISKDNEIIISSSVKFMATLRKQIDEASFFYSMLLEPISKNTGVAFLLSCLFTLEKFGDQKILFLPTDQILEVEKFSHELESSLKQIDKYHIYCFGTKPKYFSKEYGYFVSHNRNIEKFIEKPDKGDMEYLATKDPYCNSGIYFGYVSAFIAEFKVLEPDLFSRLEQIYKLAFRVNNQLFFETILFQNLKNASFDKLIATRSKNLCFFRLKSYWNDIGSFEQFWHEGQNNNQLVFSHDIDQVNLDIFIKYNSSFSYRKNGKQTILSKISSL